jgi:DNA polymerase-3 subunit alpha
MMGFATLDDRTGRLEVAAFSGIFDKYRNLLAKDTLLVAEGSLAMDDFTNSLRMTAEKLYSMEQAREIFARAIVLNWDSRQWPSERSFVDALAEILRPFRGGLCPVSIEFAKTEAKANLQLGDDWRVYPSDELLTRLRRLLAMDAVQVRY